MTTRMVLKSTDSKAYYPQNQTWNFRVRLPRSLPLKGYWTVELTEISILRVESTKFQNEIYVYCSLCDDSIVGDQLLPLLRRVYIEKTGNAIFLRPYRIPLRFNDLRDVHVYIKDSQGRDASFLAEELTVTLVLRRR